MLRKDRVCVMYFQTASILEPIRLFSSIILQSISISLK